MRRAVHIGLFIGIVLGMCACATAQDGRTGARGPYGAIDAGRTR